MASLHMQRDRTSR